jgi:uncharacterized protein YciW
MHVKHADAVGFGMLGEREMMMDEASVIERLAGLDGARAGAGGLDAVLRQRAEILSLCEQSHRAILTPREPGGLPHVLRAALAARMALANRDAALEAHYRGLMGGADAALAVVAAGGSAPAGADAAFGMSLAAIVRHVDLMTRHVPAAGRADIDALKTAGLTEPDIVRLQELIAFVNFQVRVIAGLRALGEAA